MSSGECHVERLRFRELRIPFKVAFRHASAERAETSSVWVEAIAHDGTIGCGESCPRPYVTGETLATARAFVLSHEAALRTEVTSVETLQRWLDGLARVRLAHPEFDDKRQHDVLVAELPDVARTLGYLG